MTTKQIAASMADRMEESRPKIKNFETTSLWEVATAQWLRCVVSCSDTLLDLDSTFTAEDAQEWRRQFWMAKAA